MIGFGMKIYMVCIKAIYVFYLIHIGQYNDFIHYHLPIGFGMFASRKQMILL